MSFLEMLDVVNERLIEDGQEPIAFDNDCREGICGTCGADDQRPGPRAPEGHGHLPAAHAQVHRRRDDHHRAVAGDGLPGHQGPHGRPQPVRRHHRGRWLHHAPTPARRPTPTSSRSPRPAADAAMDAAACIGCGACVAACPNGAGQLFTSAKIAHLNLLPQGQAERWSRTENMVDTMEEFFGSCTNHGECEEACPKEISHRLHRLHEPRLRQGQAEEPQAARAAVLADVGGAGLAEVDAVSSSGGPHRPHRGGRRAPAGPPATCVQGGRGRAGVRVPRGVRRRPTAPQISRSCSDGRRRWAEPRRWSTA